MGRLVGDCRTAAVTQITSSSNQVLQNSVTGHITRPAMMQRVYIHTHVWGGGADKVYPFFCKKLKKGGGLIHHHVVADIVCENAFLPLDAGKSHKPLLKHPCPECPVVMDTLKVQDISPGHLGS